MSWTSLTTVRKHLQDASVGAAAIENEEQILNGTAISQLAHKSLTSDSEEVKTLDMASPHATAATVLTGTAWKNLEHEDFVPNTMVVTADQALDTVYIEGTDYVVDYENGKLRRVTGTSIPDEGSVYIWYYYFTLHTKDIDYEIAYASGQLNRIDGGAIADGSTVYVDYSTEADTVTDDLINQAILEAEDKIAARLSENYTTSSTDQGLITGSTELTLAIVCNAKAMDMMMKLLSNDADGAAKQWKDLSHRFEAQAWRTLDRFLKVRAWRGAQALTNQSWSFPQSESPSGDR